MAKTPNTLVSYAPLLEASSYLHAVLSASTTFAAGSFIGGFTQTTAERLALTSIGQVILKAGVTYELEASVSFGNDIVSTATTASYIWQDTNGNTYGNQALLISANQNINSSQQPMATAIVTPTEDITVGLMCVHTDSQQATNQLFGYIKIKSIANMMPVVTELSYAAGTNAYAKVAQAMLDMETADLGDGYHVYYNTTEGRCYIKNSVGVQNVTGTTGYLSSVGGVGAISIAYSMSSILVPWSPSLGVSIGVGGQEWIEFTDDLDRSYLIKVIVGTSLLVNFQRIK